RRQKATSNICSNQSLMALYVTIYLSVMGRQGLREVAEQSYAAAHYLADELLATGLCHLAYEQPFFNEFCVTFDDLKADDILDTCADWNIAAGVKIDDNTLMLAVTEQRTREEMDDLVNIIKRIKEDKA
ncbi:MAG: glycine dehydrogenase, partial [Prevotella sp.]|nr:glycine dehydrogenase [Prevotella sp.]